MTIDRTINFQVSIDSPAKSPFLLVLLLLLQAITAHVNRADNPSDSNTTARLEALNRLSPDLYQRSPKIQQLVNKIVSSSRNDIRLVPTIIRFQIPDRSTDLISLAKKFPNDKRADDAITYILKSAPDALDSTQIESPILQTLLARNASEAALEKLLPTISEPSFNKGQQAEIISTICKNRTGAARLLQFSKIQNEPLQKTISHIAIPALAQTPWQDLRAQFSELAAIPPESSQEARINIPELLLHSGDIERGREVYRMNKHSCINCHVAEDVGRDIGPPLSEIGTKLGKDALFEAILNPNAGISFDYEGWNLTLNSGDEHSGILLSRSTDEITMKNLLGQTIRSPKSEIFELEKMSTSLMPSGLGQLLGKQNLVDLVAYLSSLRAPEPDRN